MNTQQLSTAQAGIWQSRAYRNLHKFMTVQLTEYDLSMPEWGVLGSLLGSDTSMSDIAEQMDYELSHVSNISTKLEDRGLLKRVVSKQDRRQKSLSLTDKGRVLSKDIESGLRTELKKWLGDIDMLQLASYINTVKAIAKKDINT